MKSNVKFAVLFIVALMLLAGCATGSTTSPETTTTENVVIRVAAQATSGQVFQYLAEDNGYLEEEGIDVEMVYINSGADAFAALSSGQVDILSTYGTGGPLIQIANGQDWTIFGGYMIIGATPVFAMPDTEYNSVEDFRGKKIAIMRGGTPDVVLKGILYDAGFDLDEDVTFVEMRRNPDVMEAVRKGEVDFGAVSTGFELQIAEMGMEIVLWPDELWPYHSCCRMLANTSWVDENPDAAEKLFRAYLRAEKDMNEDMSRVVELVVENLDMPEETAKSFLLSEHMIYDTDPFKNSVIKMWEKMNAFGYIEDSSIKIEDHINVDHYKAALDSLMMEYPDSTFFQEKLEMFKEHNL
ncbi:ABC transporter substrate-binding protein [Anoxynatronum sibiricum]|uniref:ABC transporter substrate-binding protein n=1 Tax=Anoxynatronum sibiricum TaxID=210623 RepID=A0ABU9W1L0_9CLOT